MIDFFTFSQVSYFYADMKTCDKKEYIKNHYTGRLNINEFENWMRCISELRNITAHFSRLYYHRFTSAPYFAKRKNISKPTRMLFEQTVILKLLIKDKTYRNQNVICPICLLIDKYKKHIEVKHIGFDTDYKSQLTL